MRKLFVTLSLLIAISMTLAACGGQPAAEPEVITVVETQVVEVEKVVEVEVEPEAPAGPKVFRGSFGYGDVPTVDPALATDTSSVQIDYEAFIGLIRQHEETNAIDPGMAESWDVVNNDDGTATYTFHLRNDVPWVKFDGSEVVQVTDDEGNVRIVNAHDFEYGIKRMLDPATASDYAYVSVFALKGADLFNGGEGTADDVAVTAVDDFTLEVTFNDQAVYNVAIIGMWIHAATPQWVIEERGDRWNEVGFFQSYGPYTLKEWIHDSSITMVANPFWPGTDAVPKPKIDELTWFMLDAIPAFAEYEAGNLDVAAVPLDDLDRVKADPVLSEELSIAPVQCTYYYGFNGSKPFVDDVRVRRALSYAVDRVSLIENVTKGGQEPAQWFSRPGLFGAPTMEKYYPELGIGYDPDAAQAELQSYLDETGLTAADLDLTLMFNTSSGHQKIAEAIQQMWKDVLGVDVKLSNQEWKVYLKTIQEDAPQIWRLGWCSDYAHANNFIKEVFGGGGGYDDSTFIFSEEMDAIMAEAAMESDPDKAMELYAQAEQILVYDTAEIIPIYFYTGVNVTKPYVERTYGVGGQEFMEKWDILPH
jgi:oligopeptide transport system substrate-binding protein